MLYLPGEAEEGHAAHSHTHTKRFLTSGDTCHKNRHVETLDILLDAAADRRRRWRRIISGKQSSSADCGKQQLRWKQDSYFRNVASDILSRALTTAILVKTDCRQTQTCSSSSSNSCMFAAFVLLETHFIFCSVTDQKTKTSEIRFFLHIHTFSYQWEDN